MQWLKTKAWWKVTNAYDFFVFSSRRQPPLLVWRWVIGLRAYTVIPLYLLCLWRPYKPKILSMIYFLRVHSQLRKKAGMLSVWRGKAFLQNVNSSTVLSKQFWVKILITVGFSAVLCSIGVKKHISSKNEIIPRALFE